MRAARTICPCGRAIAALALPIAWLIAWLIAPVLNERSHCSIIRRWI